MLKKIRIKNKFGEEMLDLVDKNDRVIGEVGISQAHCDSKLIHREVGVFIFDRDKKILLNKRKLTKHVDPGIWTAMGEHVERGEEPEAAAHRGLKEEYGFDTKLIFVGKFFQQRPKESRFAYFYLGKYTGEKIAFEKEEMTEVKFFGPKDLEMALERGSKFGPSSMSVARDLWAGNLDNFVDLLESGHG